MEDYLGYQKHDVTGRGTENSRRGTCTKTVLTDNAGKVAIETPRDCDGTFKPVIVAKHQCPLGDVDMIALSLFEKGLTTGESSAHLEEICGA